MGLARFIVKDPYLPAATEEEVEDLFCKIHGVTNWTIQSDGEVTFAYDRYLISDETVEAALDGLGFELEHVFDNPYAGEVSATEPAAR